MNKKRLLRFIAVTMACMGMGVFAFSGCKKDDEPSGDKPGTEATTPTTPENPGGGTTTPETPTTPTTPENPGGGTTTPETPTTPTTPENPGGGTTTPETPTTPTTPEPEIPEPVKGGPTITKYSSEELETAYVEWTAAENAKWYNVYVKEHAAADTAYAKLDSPLVREYKKDSKTYFRADAVGLKAGTYDMKVVPVSADGEEVTEYAAPVKNLTVKAQDRSGYAFVGGNMPGAYKADGTLKAGAQVFYVTAATAKTIKTTVNKKGKPTEVTGFQSIIDARQDSGDETPLCFRIVGTVNRSDLDHISSSEEGLQFKGTTNITLEGVGNDGTINGFGMLIRNCNNVEIKNLGIVNFMDDGVSVDTKNTYLWMHNLDIFYGNAGGDSDQAKGDGSLDIKKSQYCTVSYNHFWDSGKCCLLDASAASSGSNYMTYHHNWFDHSDSRHARVRNATAVHIYNNYFDGNSKYGVGATTGSSTFVESNYFRSTSSSTKAMMIADQGTDAKGDGTFSGESGGMIKGYGNTFDLPYKPISHKTSATDFDFYEAASCTEQVPSSVTTKAGSTYSNFDTASDFYQYTADPAEQAKANVERYAGRVDGGDLKWDFDDATEDGNYAIISGLKAAVVGYKSSIVKIGDVTVSGGSTGGSTEGGSTGGGNEGGDTPVTPPATVEGEIRFVPSASGSGFTVTGNTDSSAGAKVVDGVSVAAGKALKIESSTKIEFTVDKVMTLTVYLNGSNIKVDGKKTVSGSTADGLSVITVELEAGTHELTKADKGTIYLIKLTPKS